MGCRIKYTPEQLKQARAGEVIDLQVKLPEARKIMVASSVVYYYSHARSQWIKVNRGDQINSTWPVLYTYTSNTDNTKKWLRTPEHEEVSYI